jgi:hypothetical protein
VGCEFLNGSGASNVTSHDGGWGLGNSISSAMISNLSPV